jgi:NAD(P)-dependent dehydrogenase (short-subunit alcohol dehydrogenase family)
VPAYHASKGAVRLMSKTDALLYAADRIRVNSVHPGFIWTPMVEQHLRGSGATDMARARRGGRAASARAHGRARRHRLGGGLLASEESKFVTGAELVVDGGYTAR